MKRAIEIPLALWLAALIMLGMLRLLGWRATRTTTTGSALIGISETLLAREQAAADDAKCQGYGAKPGEPAYVQCRAQLDAARTAARQNPPMP